MKVTVIQSNVTDDQQLNLAKMQRLLAEAVAADLPDLVVFPEMVACISISPSKMRESAGAFPGSELFEAFSAMASAHNVLLHIGSAMELEDDRVYNTSLLFGRTGELLGKYRKIHRFDVVLPDGTEIKESKNVARGERVVCVPVESFNLGMTICYDLRFPELFRAIADKGADVIVVPSAFTFQTGADHWEPLLRARAIETQCYIVAPGQTGTFENGKFMNYGHSMIVDPWGQVIAQASNGEGFATTRIDRKYIETVRARIPLRQHRIL
ncbi:carbon-nitrogen hydrolase family protein [Paraburkholderia sacchari]|uniref:carbon-nitrogen hydrolase family protein n=1 Tax=Paraburkholderia sacchari TaxID=159450 RepID=UPI0005425E4E|nr:carbon-nitrogen hydrolase family protein [Paraburkholderia sacchari]NLP63477.1 carbon-nitrogen hydrolase family protein [Paraburkholderia sacchari]